MRIVDILMGCLSGRRRGLTVLSHCRLFPCSRKRLDATVFSLVRGLSNSVRLCNLTLAVTSCNHCVGVARLPPECHRLLLTDEFTSRTSITAVWRPDSQTRHQERMHNFSVHWSRFDPNPNIIKRLQEQGCLANCLSQISTNRSDESPN